MSKPIEQILASKPEARPRIYAYAIADAAHAGLLKIGQTTRDVKTRLARRAISPCASRARLMWHIFVVAQSHAPEIGQPPIAQSSQPQILHPPSGDYPDASIACPVARQTHRRWSAVTANPARPPRTAKESLYVGISRNHHLDQTFAERVLAEDSVAKVLLATATDAKKLCMEHLLLDD